MHILSQTFIFDAAHTLHRDGVDKAEVQSSKRIHGHSYKATVYITGSAQDTAPDGMVMDLALLRQKLQTVKDQLDHRHLDHVEGLGIPTLENLCVFIWNALQPELPTLHRIKVERPLSGDACSYQPSV